MIGALPESIEISGEEWEIRTDYRNVLQSLEAYADPELDNYSKYVVITYLMIYEFSNADDVEMAVKNGFDLVEAAEQIFHFIVPDERTERKEELQTYDWKQDEHMIFSAINKVAGKEVRELEYMHWWTFLGYFNEIGEGVLSFIIGIRDKINHRKKLEEYEKDFCKKNMSLVLLKKPMTEEEEKEEKEFQSLIDDVIG